MSKLPSDWAMEGFFCLEGWRPKVGVHCDYYDRDGIKRQGTVKGFDGKTIVIEGERKIYITDTFDGKTIVIEGERKIYITDTFEVRQGR